MRVVARVPEQVDDVRPRIVRVLFSAPMRTALGAVLVVLVLKLPGAFERKAVAPSGVIPIGYPQVIGDGLAWDPPPGRLCAARATSVGTLECERQRYLHLAVRSLE